MRCARAWASRVSSALVGAFTQWNRTESSERSTYAPSRKSNYETLTGGCIEGCEIICPRHGARFDIKTGEALTPPAYEPVATLPVRVENGMVQVMDDRWG